LSESLKFIDRLSLFLIRSKIKPRPNSIAEKTKKKNVKDSKFKLSKIKPAKSTIAYKVIHKISAVNNKCNAVLVFSIKLKKIKLKKIKSTLISPKSIYS
jgi:hypothetical protein